MVSKHKTDRMYSIHLGSSLLFRPLTRFPIRKEYSFSSSVEWNLLLTVLMFGKNTFCFVNGIPRFKKCNSDCDFHFFVFSANCCSFHVHVVPLTFYLTLTYE